MVMLEVARDTLWTEDIFRTFLYEIDRNLIIEYISKFKQENNGHIKSNAGGWQCDYTAGDCKEIDKVIVQMTDIVNHVFFDIYKMKCRKIEAGSVWINENKKGDYNMTHTHGGVYSGIYYIKTTNTRESGDLVLDNPNLYSIASTFDKVLQDPEDFSAYDTEFVRIHKTITAIENESIVFPPWYPHQVMANKTDCDRLSLAMNFV